MVKRVFHIYLRLTKGDGYEKRVDDEIRNYVLTHTAKSNRYAGLVVWSFAKKARMKDKSKLDNLETIEHIFEGHMFPIPKCYDYCLKLIYGNYMQLPPENERKPYHGYKIYKA